MGKLWPASPFPIAGSPTPFPCLPLVPPSLRICVSSRSEWAIQAVLRVGETWIYIGHKFAGTTENLNSVKSNWLLVITHCALVWIWLVKILGVGSVLRLEPWKKLQSQGWQADNIVPWAESSDVNINVKTKYLPSFPFGICANHTLYKLCMYILSQQDCKCYKAYSVII
jgi:hypothetical protein